MFTLSIETDNDAFTNGEEIARILKEVVIQLESGKEFGTIKDINGNTVGDWSK
jgi:hypothetical protein